MRPLSAGPRNSSLCLRQKQQPCILPTTPNTHSLTICADSQSLLKAIESQPPVTHNLRSLPQPTFGFRATNESQVTTDADTRTTTTATINHPRLISYASALHNEHMDIIWNRLTDSLITPEKCQITILLTSIRPLICLVEKQI